MRRWFLLIVLMAIAVPARAQQGTLTLDAMTTPGRHFGMGYYVSDHISLRPSLGLGYSSNTGTWVNVGADVRFEFTPHYAWTGYATGTAFYQSGQEALYSGYGQGAGNYGPAGQAGVSIYGQGTSYGAGIGVLRRINDRFSVYLDGRYLHSQQPSLATDTAIGQYRVDGQNQIIVALGMSFVLGH